MVEDRLQIKNEVGLHERAASVLVNSAMGFASDVFLVKDAEIYNAKSIMSVLSMSASKGDEILIRVEGRDEEEAIQALKKLVEEELPQM